MRGKRFDFDFVLLVFTAGPWTVDPMPLVITDFLGSHSIEARWISFAAVQMELEME